MSEDDNMICEDAEVWENEPFVNLDAIGTLSPTKPPRKSILENSDSNESSSSDNGNTSDNSRLSRATRVISRVWSRFTQVPTTECLVRLEINVPSLNKGEGVRERRTVINVGLPKLNDVSMALEELNDLTQRLLREYHFLHTLVEHNDGSVVNDMVCAETKWIGKMPRRRDYKEYLDLRRLSAWLTMRVEMFQRALYDHHPNIITTAGQIIGLNNVVISRPVFLPDGADCKPSGLNLRTMIHMRDACFGVRPHASAKIGVAGALDQPDYDEFTRDPIQSFIRYIRYMGLNIHELCDLLFHYDSEGKRRTSTCPCGVKVHIAANFVRMHDCALSKLFRSFLPGFWADGGIQMDRISFSESERSYVEDVLRIRRPELVTQRRGDSTATVLRRVGQPDQVMSQVVLSDEEKHRRTCIARQNCPRCRPK